ncbi:unnamed protein product [Ilex paraguariensis]|uniref:DPH4-like protein n=1 Tax=Ilex paraguariensis TaxID=185542 RepID=A0ABC8T6R3_9AQUA
MLINSSAIHRTHYDILGVKEDASYEAIRLNHRTAILNSHPDKLQKTSETPNPDLEPGDRFVEVQRAWEILSNPRSRAVYDNELRALRQDTVTAEDVCLEDLTVEDSGEILELFYRCQCGDYFSVDSLELGEMGYQLLRNGNKVYLETPSALPASFVLPCGSCSLNIRLLINVDMSLPTNDHS